jgi:hypothetical protein
MRHVFSNILLRPSSYLAEKRGNKSGGRLCWIAGVARGKDIKGAAVAAGMPEWSETFGAPGGEEGSSSVWLTAGPGMDQREQR